MINIYFDGLWQHPQPAHILWTLQGLSVDFPLFSVSRVVVSSINIKNLTVIDQFVDDVMKGKDL